MRRTTRSVDETLFVYGSSTRAVSERVEMLLRGVDRYRVSTPADNVVQIARSLKGVVRRRTSLCTIRAVTDPQRLVVTITGELEEVDLDRVRSAVLGQSSEHTVITSSYSFRPAEGAATGSFTPPSEWFVGPTKATSRCTCVSRSWTTTTGSSGG